MWKALTNTVFSGGTAQQGNAMGPGQLQTAPVAGESSKPSLPSPGSDDLQPGYQADQVPHPRGGSKQHQQQSSGIIEIDASESEDAGYNSSGTAAQAIAAAAARLRQRSQQQAAAAPGPEADVISISDSEDLDQDDASDSDGSDQQDPSSSDCEDRPSTRSNQQAEQQQKQQQRPQRQQTQQGRVTRHAAQQLQAPQRQSSRQLRGSRVGRAAVQQQQASSSDSEGDSSGQDTSSTDSDSDASRSSSSSSESDDDAAGGTHTRQRPGLKQGSQRPSTCRRSGTDQAVTARASAGTSKARSGTAPAKQRAAPPAAAVTPRKSTRPQPAASTPSRPTRSCTETPQRSTRTGAAATAAAGGSSHPSLATPMGKLNLGSSKAADSPSTAARATRRSIHTPAAPPAPATSSKAPAATPSKRQGSRSAAAATPKAKRGPKAGNSKVVPLKQVVVEDLVILPGDDVYLMLDEYEDPDSEEEEEACAVCSSSSCTRGNAMLECGSCLRGFHMKCLKPKLTKIPEGDWLCPGCNAGEPPAPPANLVSEWQKLLYGRNEVAMVHVQGVQRGLGPEGEEEDQMRVRYYILPQDTHLGRQPHHASREVFLGSKDFIEPTTAVMGRAYVHPPVDFQDAPESEGNDVYLCEYEYDEAWKRFRKRRYGDAGPDDVGAAGASCPMTPAGLRLTPGKGKGSTPHAGGSGGRRLFEVGSSSGSDGEYSGDSDDEGDDNYRPELHHLSGRGKGSLLSKRKRHGQLPGTSADKFLGLGAADIDRERVELRDAFAKLHGSLSLGSVPDSLPCRDEERQRLGGFLNRALHEDGGVLYICGVPGTGKTALVMEMLRGLAPQALRAGAQVVAINCLQLPTPQHVFSRLWEKLSGQHLGPARACEALMQSFGISGSGASRRRQYSTIILLDEIDMLMTRDQAVLYQLFDWPNQPGSRLAVIGISNTHDLDQRVLPRIASRLDQAKLAFAPYSVAQLQTIVGQRLQESGVAGAVEDMAVMLTCRKVASETGDVRRALELLRRAVEIGRAEHLRSTVVARTAAAAAAAKQPPPKDHDVVVEWQQGSPALVKRPHVTQAQQEMFGALHLQLLRSRSLWEKLLLVAVVVEARATGRNAVVLQSVAERASSSICALVDLAPPALGVLQHCLVKLASVRLLLSDGCHIKAQLALNVDKDDVAIAIKEDERLSKLHTLL